MKFYTKNYSDDRAIIVREQYPDGTVKLAIHGKQFVCVPTICLRDLNEQPAPGCVFIADYGTNEGALSALQEAGVVGWTDRIIETGTHTRDPLRRRPVHEVRLLRTDV
jgi:hypothetical protein